MARSATVIAFIRLLGVLVFAIGGVAGHAVADDRARMDEPFEITADRIIFDDVRNLYVAEGRVRVDQSNRRLKARWLAFSTETRIGVAEGDVQLDDGPDQLRAEFMVFDIDTLHGMLFQGSLSSGSSGFRVRALELVRTGQNTFTIRDGAFSTCRCEPGERLPWEFRSQEADVDLGGYAKLKNSTFNVLGVPVLWIPWTFIPVKSERETGFLLPTFEFGGRGGAAVGLPFFWAAMPQLNVTLTPHYFADRGYKQDLELEYVFGERSEGTLFLAGLPGDQTHNANSTFDSERWAVLWEHDQELPLKWRWQTDLKLSSDNLYAEDFLELRHYRAFRFVESTTNLARDFGASGGVGAMLGARYADDIQGSTFEDQDKHLLQRWAEVRGDIQPGVVTGPFGVETRIDSELIHFSSREGITGEIESLNPGAPGPLHSNGRFYDFGFNGKFDGVNEDGEGDGIYQNGEPLAERGTRVVIHPRLARRFRLGELAEFVPEVGWQQTLYRTNAREFAERGLFTARSELRGRLARDYFGERGRAVRHIMEPSLKWAFVSQRGQRKNPLFIPRADVEQSRLRVLSLENVTRDPADRIEETNQIVLALGQRFFVRDRANRAPRLRADIVTAIDWDFAGNGGLGNIYAEGRLFSVGPLGASVRAAFDPEAAKIEEGELGLNVRVPGVGRLFRRAMLETTYRYRRFLPLFEETVRDNPSKTETTDDELNQLNWTARIELSERVRLTYRGIYSFSGRTGFLRNRGILDYVSKCRCWGIGLTVAHERQQGFSGGFQIRLVGLGDESRNLFEGGIGAGADF